MPGPQLERTGTEPAPDGSLRPIETHPPHTLMARTHTDTHTYPYAQAHTHTHTHVSTHKHTQVSTEQRKIHAEASTQTHVSTHTHTHTHVSTQKHTHAHPDMYPYTRIYKNTFTLNKTYRTYTEHTDGNTRHTKAQYLVS